MQIPQQSLIFCVKHILLVGICSNGSLSSMLSLSCRLLIEFTRICLPKLQAVYFTSWLLLPWKHLQKAYGMIGHLKTMVCRKQKIYPFADDKRVPLIGKKRVRLVGTASLQITDVQPEDEGWYTCEAADNTNHKTRSSAYLKVLCKLFSVKVISTFFFSSQLPIPNAHRDHFIAASTRLLANLASYLVC